VALPSEVWSVFSSAVMVTAVNNAGVFRGASIESTTEAIWDFQVDLNMKATFFFARGVLPHLRLRGEGRRGQSHARLGGRVGAGEHQC